MLRDLTNISRWDRQRLQNQKSLLLKNFNNFIAILKESLFFINLKFILHKILYFEQIRFLQVI